MPSGGGALGRTEGGGRLFSAGAPIPAFGRTFPKGGKGVETATKRLFPLWGSTREAGDGGSSGVKRPLPHPRSFAATALAAAATIFPDSASISASVSVRSRGCTVTSTATDFDPSGTPAPS